MFRNFRLRFGTSEKMTEFKLNTRKSGFPELPVQGRNFRKMTVLHPRTRAGRLDRNFRPVTGTSGSGPSRSEDVVGSSGLDPCGSELMAGTSGFDPEDAVRVVVESLGLSFSLIFETSSSQSNLNIPESYFASLFIVRHLYSISKYKIELNLQLSLLTPLLFP